MHLPSKIRSAPIAFALVALSSLVFLLFKELGFYGSILQLFNFVPVELTPRGGRLGEPGNDWWRFITPTLLHFSWMHLVFNCLWIWEFGRRIEGVVGFNEFVGLIFGFGSIFKQRAIFYFWAVDFRRYVWRGLCVHEFHMGG